MRAGVERQRLAMCVRCGYHVDVPARRRAAHHLEPQSNFPGRHNDVCKSLGRQRCPPTPPTRLDSPLIGAVFLATVARPASIGRGVEERCRPRSWMDDPEPGSRSHCSRTSPRFRHRHRHRGARYDRRRSHVLDGEVHAPRPFDGEGRGAGGVSTGQISSIAGRRGRGEADGHGVDEGADDRRRCRGRQAVTSPDISAAGELDRIFAGPGSMPSRRRWRSTSVRRDEGTEPVPPDSGLVIELTGAVVSADRTRSRILPTGVSAAASWMGFRRSVALMPSPQAMSVTSPVRRLGRSSGPGRVVIVLVSRGWLAACAHNRRRSSSSAARPAGALAGAPRSGRLRGVRLMEESGGAGRRCGYTPGRRLDGELRPPRAAALHDGGVADADDRGRSRSVIPGAHADVWTTRTRGAHPRAESSGAAASRGYHAGRTDSTASCAPSTSQSSAHRGDRGSPR